MTKRCAVCGKEKELEFFHKDNKGKLGRKNICKDCRNKYSRQKQNVRIVYNKLFRCIINSLKKNRAGRCFKYLDFTFEEFKQSIESKMYDNFSWGNFGSVWSIDFIVPRKIYKSIKEYKKCFSLKNMKPASIEFIKNKQGRISFDEVEFYSSFDLLPLGRLNG